MKTYLLTWNPRSSPWDELPQQARALAAGQRVDLRWSCGNTRSIAVGARIYVLRQSEEPKGIIASGQVTTPPFEAAHWMPNREAAGETAHYIRFDADALIDPALDLPLDLRDVPAGPLAELQLDAPASGNSIPEHVADALGSAWAEHLAGATTAPAMADPELVAYEGEQRRYYAIHRSRERALRERKLRQVVEANGDGRLRCEVPGCGFDFEAVYGPIGAGFAQVHHLRPLAASASPVSTTLADLAVVCANCHAMIHRGGECRPLEGLIPSSRIPPR